MTVFKPVAIHKSHSQPVTRNTTPTEATPTYQSKIDKALSQLDITTTTRKRSVDTVQPPAVKYAYSAGTSPAEYQRRTIVQPLTQQLPYRPLHSQQTATVVKPVHSTPQVQPRAVQQPTVSAQHKLGHIKNADAWLHEWFKLSPAARTNALHMLNQSLRQQHAKQLHKRQPLPMSMMSLPVQTPPMQHRVMYGQPMTVA